MTSVACADEPEVDCTASTFNPILEARQLRRFPWQGLRLRPTINTALVLMSDDPRPVVLQPGSRLTRTLARSFHDVYFVDMREHILRLECKLPCRDYAFLFSATLNYACQVSDPVEIVKYGRADAGAVVGPMLAQVMRGSSRDFGADQGGEAEKCINDRLSGTWHRAGFAINDCIAELTLDSDVATNIRKIHNTRESVEAERIETDYLMQLMETGDVGLVAMYISEHREHAGTIVELFLRKHYDRGQQLIEVLKVILADSDSDLDFDVDIHREQIIKNVASQMGIDGDSQEGGEPLWAGSRGATRISASLLGKIDKARKRQAEGKSPVADKDGSADGTSAAPAGETPNGQKSRNPDPDG